MFVIYLSRSDRRETSYDFEIISQGVIIPMGLGTEIFIPWNRVLEIWTERGGIRRTLEGNDHGPTDADPT